MKIKVVVALFVCLLVLSGTHFLRTNALPPAPSSFRFESGMFVLMPDDYLKINLENPDVVAHTYRVVVFGTIGGTPLVTVLDTGTVSLPAGQGTHIDYGVATGGGNDHGVSVTLDSDLVVPSISVFSNCPGVSCPAFEPPRYWQAGAQLTKYKQ